MAPTFQLSNITLSSTKDSKPTPFYGLQDAFNPRCSAPGKCFKYPSLFPDACQQDDGERNCTTACQKNKQMFASLETLHNCVVWPSIYAENERNGLLPFAADLASSLGLEKGSEGSLPSSISNSIQDCLLDSCDASEGFAPNANKPFPKGFRDHFSHKLTGDAYYGSDESLPYFDPCPYIDARASPDVAGIGVFISYGMQTGLALMAFILAVPWRSAAYGIENAVLVLRRRLGGNKEAAGRPKDLTTSNLDRRESVEQGSKHTMKFEPASAIIPAVVEFQKAQCYFMLATNIASLIIQHDGGLKPANFQQLYNTYVFIKVIAISGYLPITFGLLILRMLNKVGWYLLALSIASIGVAIGDLYTERFFSPSPEDLKDLQSQSTRGGPSSCGEHNPIAWCYSRIGVNRYGFRATNEGDGANNILVVCLVTFGLLTMEHFWNSPDPTNRRIRDIIFRVGVWQPKNDRPSRWFTVARWFWKYVVPGLFAIWILGYLYCFAVFAYDLNWFRINEIYDSSWGFGQIVAVSVWAPTLIEYFWEMFRGIEDGSDHRLPHGYEIRKKETEGRNELGLGEWSDHMRKGA